VAGIRGFWHGVFVGLGLGLYSGDDMMSSGFRFPSPAQPMKFDGERYTSGVEGPIQREHYHRYLFALRYCVDKAVLDVASGEGYGSFLLGQVARSVIGVDIDQTAIEFANKNYRSERVSFRRGDAAKLPVSDHSIDVVVSFETVEHFAEQAGFIAEIDRVLRPDGLVIMSSPNREIYSEAQKYDNPFHVHEMNRAEFVSLLGLRFPNIHLLEQGAVIGSIIVSVVGEGTDNIEGFTTRDGQQFQRRAGVPGAPYFIALAAHALIPEPPQSILHSDFYQEQIELRLRAEIDAQREKAVIAAERERETAAQHTELHEQFVRQLALTRTVRASKLPSKLRGIRGLIGKERRHLASDYRVVASSPLFDRDWYLKRNPDVAAALLDPVLHYLRYGADEGRQPSPLFNSEEYVLANPDVAAAHMNPLLHFLKYGVHEGRALERGTPVARSALSTEAVLSGPKQDADPSFDAVFLKPFYAAAGRSEEPISVWRDLSAAGAVPATRQAAEAVAAAVRQSQFFNTEFYSRRLPEGMDPALHYAVIGEAMGWSPSELFDPHFYTTRYPDIRAARLSPLMHFQDHGLAEQRRGVPAAKHMVFPPLKDERRPILIICHEASRAGAPVLGWNLVRDLRKKYPVVTLLMRGGVLEPDFVADSDVVVGPLTDEDWHPAEFAAIAERLVQTYQPLYAVANSVVTSPFVPPLGVLGVPSVALVHEFACYTRPVEWMRSTFDWAAHIVFPAQVVADSSFENFPELERRRGIHVLAQGRQQLPRRKGKVGVKAPADVGRIVRSAEEKDRFIVLGVGRVEVRKGVDLFLSVAAAAQRLAPDVRFKFVWIGGGYKPESDATYSVYLHEQIHKSNLQDSVVFLEPVEHIAPAYRAADVFLMSSRLDPQPNVCIDALTDGLPTVCFAGAGGTGEVLVGDPETRSLVVPYLDVEAAAQEVCRLANDPALRKRTSRAVSRVARCSFNAETYVAHVDAWGREAAAALSQGDLETLISSGAVDRYLALPPGPPILLPQSATAEQVMLLQSTIGQTSPNQHRNPYFRRAIPGFHPQVYAHAHVEDCGPGGQEPTAHWLRHGRPPGPWSHPVFSPAASPADPGRKLRVALHAHFHYPELADDLVERLIANRTQPDVFVSTDTKTKAKTLRLAFAKYGGRSDVRVMPNIGRDIGPLLTGFGAEISSERYEVWGHVHGKKSISASGIQNDAWRTFLWDNLIGGGHPMLDVAVSAFASDPKLGLIFAEDPHLVGWDGNRANAELLVQRMGFSCDLPEFFDFPLGTMFWFRPSALRRLFALRLDWEDYPKEPVPYDGSLLHAIERIVPFATTAESYTFAGLRAPHTNW
jgi:glycosyltransferase involved in cell wall biosynthesis/SAM-dependent methyltransferase